MAFARRIIGKTLDLLNLQRHNDNYAEIETDLTNHESRITGAQSDITTHKASEKAHPAEHVTYSGAVVGATNIKEGLDNVKDTLDNVIIGGGDGTQAAAAAVSVSGTTYTTLKQRVDTEYLETDVKFTVVSEQLAETAEQVGVLGVTKAEQSDLDTTNNTVEIIQSTMMEKTTTDISVSQINKNLGKFDQTYMTEEFLQQIVGNTSINAVPADASLGKEKFTFRVLEGEASKNIFNADTITLQRYVNSTGGLTFNTSYSTSDYIPVLPNTTYVTNHFFSGAYYDSAKVFISTIAAAKFTTPANADSIRFTVPNGNVAQTQLEIGSVSTRYMSHKNTVRKDTIPTITNDLIGKGEIQADKLAFQTIVAVPSKNRFDKTTVTTSRYITDAGALVFSGGYNVTDYIPVTVQPYALNQLSFGNVICYDASKTYLGYVSRSSSVFTPLPGTAFIRFTVTDADLNTTQIEAGSIVTAYESFGNKVSADLITGLNIPKVPTVIRVTVATSGGDFTSASAALASITDASETKRYEIFVKIGTYIDTFRTKHYVDIIGEDKYQTIIDYTGTVETWNATSTVFAESQCTIKNLTLIGTDTKYPLHIDKATGKWTCVIENVRMIHKGSLTDATKAGTPLGVGLYPYQYLIVKNCEMIDRSGAFGSSGVYFHNQYDSIGTGYRSIRIEECRISGVTYGIRPNDVEGISQQNNDAYIINNDITATHQEYYYPENSPAWHLFKRGNEYTRG
ncbi:hypothetical protein CA600_12420 [Paenibacillus sp. VTT E-133280]|uniref:hypothetical protein n=1 Tax=Paenibacillus sp. VTT E-133280 TaxID=1986222 RepID=UPI000B9FE8B7|nr:hypothetical protein [Paenibacillus sp. VTT E-133280]OZQ66057.1 hypothetical protein CA600_12420 [Paenibacillus sp. VTT E-133280]